MNIYIYITVPPFETRTNLKAGFESNPKAGHRSAFGCLLYFLRENFQNLKSKMQASFVNEAHGYYDKKELYYLAHRIENGPTTLTGAHDRFILDWRQI
jgi:hypothetical protein